MKNIFSRLLLIPVVILAFTASSCVKKADNSGSIITNVTSKGTKIVNGKPEWYWNPGMKGNIGGVGTSGIHIKSENEQRKLAIERALDDIARQLGVKVNSYLVTATTGTQNDAKTYMGTYSVQTSDSKSVKANIEEIWKDEKSGEIHVWMVLQ
ncbi:MAG: hypothetical protein PHX78_00375 [bacterium]|nr:hypothetical protein [bacterium]